MFPAAFVDNLINMMGEEGARKLLLSLEQKPPVSIRINPNKVSDVENELDLPFDGYDHIPFSKYGYILSQRPKFGLDPSFYAGAYYVQEASSMSIEMAQSLFKDLRNNNGEESFKVLDLCAAPGGKSTHLLSILKEIPNAILVSNEVIRSRVNVLSENIAKWGHSNVIVTNNDAEDFKKLNSYFDVILVDAPCSGEGMFRKDPKSMEEWSEENVKLCASRQRRILSDVWSSLKGGGLILYSTCTFNRTENDDNVEWLSMTLGADPLFTEHIYPGKFCGEGFFLSILRKHSDSKGNNQKNIYREKVKDSILKPYKIPLDFVKKGYSFYRKGNLIKAYPENICNDMLFIESSLKAIRSGVAVASVLEGRKGENSLIPEAELALNEALNIDFFYKEELYMADKNDPSSAALKFLKKEPISFPDLPLGYILLQYKGLPLGFVKNIGNRSNNLWPSGWRLTGR